jgi:hypothetical protein
MPRTKAPLILVAAAVAAALCGSLAAAQADTTQGATGATGATGAASATITVNGSATNTATTGDTSAISAAYLSALGAALTDAHTKAAALSAQVGDTLGAVENITEQSGDGNICGVAFPAAGPVRAGTSAPATAKKHSHHHKTKAALRGAARIADVSPATCTIEADVTVTYAMAPTS